MWIQHLFFAASSGRGTGGFAGLAAVLLSLTVLMPFSDGIAQNSASPERRTDAASGRVPLAERYRLREKGLRALDDGNPATAEQFLRQYRKACATDEPDFADATILLVRVLGEQGKFAEAREALADHRRKSPGVADAYFLQGLLYWRARVAYATANWGQVLEILDAAGIASKKVHGFQDRIFELTVRAAVEAGDLDDAQARLSRFAQECPESPRVAEARLRLVRAYLEAENVDEATRVLDRLAVPDDDGLETRKRLYRMIVTLKTEGALSAHEQYEAIEAVIPQKSGGDWWWGLATLADGLMAEDEYEQALRLSEKMASVAGDRSQRAKAHLRRVSCLVKLGQVELAINGLKTFQDEFPGNEAEITVRFHFARLLRETKNPLAAAERFRAVVESEAASPETKFRAAYQQGWCFSEAGDYQSARKAFSDAARLGTTRDEQAEAFLLAGDAALELGDFAKAALAYQAVADNYAGGGFAEKARLRQAKARFLAGFYGNATVVYGQFLEEYPDSKMREEALLERAIAQKREGETEKAIESLLAFADSFPDSDRRPRAILEAALACAATGRAARGIELLERLVDGDSDMRAHGLYHRARIRFAEAEYEGAIRDCWAFLEDYSGLPLAADVYFWLADHYANLGERDQSAAYFRTLSEEQPESPLAPRALYEEARIRFEQQRYAEARERIRGFRERFPNAASEDAARAEMLYGDTLAEEGRFDEALPHYREARSLAPERGSLALAALGRVGEMHLASGSLNEDATVLQKALECFDTIASTPEVEPALRERAIYRKGKAYERMGNPDSAIAEYLDLVYSYDIDLKEGKVRDWFYFLRSGVDAARLLTLQEKHRQAARVLERLDVAGVPIPREVAAKARQIREAHDLR